MYMVIVGMMVRAFQALEQSTFVGFAFFSHMLHFSIQGWLYAHDDCFSVILILLEELTKYRPV